MAELNKGFDPIEAVSPRKNWQLIDVLYEIDRWSMALGRWRDEADARTVLAQRWNGEKGKKGNPVSHGYATWFVLPDDTYSLYLQSEFIPEGKRAFVKDILGL